MIHNQHDCILGMRYDALYIPFFCFVLYHILTLATGEAETSDTYLMGNSKGSQKSILKGWIYLGTVKSEIHAFYFFIIWNFHELFENPILYHLHPETKTQWVNSVRSYWAFGFMILNLLSVCINVSPPKEKYGVNYDWIQKKIYFLPSN